MAAGAETVASVAEVLDEGGHSALRGLGELDHAVDLAAAEGDLLVVGFAPCGLLQCACRGADVAAHVDSGCALSDEFFYSLVEGLGLHLETLAEEVGHLVVVGEECRDAGELGDGGVVAVEKEVVHLAVGVRVEQDGAAGETVAAGAAYLLVILLDGAGERSVDNGADVGFVDAHAEGYRCDDYFKVAREEFALDAFAGAGVKAGVVGGGVSAKCGGQLFGGFARRGVDNGGAVGLFFEELRGELVAAGFGELDDLDGEIVAAEAVDEESWLRELELGNDVFLDCWRRCRSEGDDGRGTEGREEVAEGAIVGAKVVAPGGDAVGLVDCYEAGLFPGEHLGEVGDAHALGRDEKELEGAVEVVAAGLPCFVAGEAGVDAGDAEAGGGEFGGLVVHEGNEGGDDEGSAAAGDGGKLVAEGFSCSGGHDEEDIAAVGGGAADSFLIGAEGREAEGLVEQGGEIHQPAQFRIMFA